MRLQIHVLLLTCAISAYKLLVITPQLANSQVIWNKRVSEALASAGHDVTMLRIAMFEKHFPEVVVDKRVKNVFINATGGRDGEEVERIHFSTIFKDYPPWDSTPHKAMSLITKGLQDACEDLVANKSLIAWLRNERFDLAFAHMYHPCPIGLIHAAAIPAWVWLNSGALMDFVADAVGAPLPPSYISPMLMDSSDTMSFYERTKSFVGHQLMKIMYPKMFVSPETAIFRRHLGDSFPDLDALQRQCPLVMVNSNELYELTRPTLHKIVNIGGLGLDFEKAKPLSTEFTSIVANAKKGVVVFSFGSAVPAEMMPMAWKSAFLSAFQEFADYQFVLRYAGTDLVLPPNVHIFKWLPQNDLMQHPRTRLLISHGGYNSLQECLSAGKPLLSIPLFGDQFKNARLAESKGFAVRLSRASLDKRSVIDALSRLLSDHSFTNAAVRLSQMIRAQPIPAEQRLVQWTEFLAEFKTLDNLIPAGASMGVVQYHCIDVIAFISLSLATVMYLFCRLVTAILCCVCRRKREQQKNKQE